MLSDFSENRSQLVPERFFVDIMLAMIVDDNKGAKGSARRRELYYAYCKELATKGTPKFVDKVVTETIVYHGRPMRHERLVTAEELIDSEIQYNAMSKFVEWKDVVDDDEIVGFVITNRHKKTKESYVNYKHRTDI